MFLKSNLITIVDYLGTDYCPHCSHSVSFQTIKVELTAASNGGSLGADRSVDIIVPANDNPYGTVYFQQSVYRVQEPLEGDYTANITIRRRYFEFMSSP